MNKAIFIVGPTAVGKTQFAFKIAEKFNGEIVSADSIQVYKGLNIISGKDLPPGYTYHAGTYTRNGSPSIHLLDVVVPTAPFSVSDFYKLASEQIRKIQSKGKTPIVAGGTGLYVEVLLYGLQPTVKPDPELRDTLRKLSIIELQELLPDGILESLNNSDKNNPRRLIRKIEIVRNKGAGMRNMGFEKTDNLVIGLECEKDVLKQRIDVRVGERLKNGALEEAARLFQNYKNLTPQVKDANGYKQLFEYLNKLTTLEEAIERWKISEYRHAKNQMTWFRKYGTVEWYDVGKENFKKEIGKRIEKFIVS